MYKKLASFVVLTSILFSCFPFPSFAYDEVIKCPNCDKVFGGEGTTVLGFVVNTGNFTCSACGWSGKELSVFGIPVVKRTYYSTTNKTPEKEQQYITDYTTNNYSPIYYSNGDMAIPINVTEVYVNGQDKPSNYGYFRPLSLTTTKGASFATATYLGEKSDESWSNGWIQIKFSVTLPTAGFYSFGCNLKSTKVTASTGVVELLPLYTDTWTRPSLSINNTSVNLKRPSTSTGNDAFSVDSKYYDSGTSANCSFAFNVSHVSGATHYSHILSNAYFIAQGANFQPVNVDNSYRVGSPEYKNTYYFDSSTNTIVNGNIINETGKTVNVGGNSVEYNNYTYDYSTRTYTFTTVDNRTITVQYFDDYFQSTVIDNSTGDRTTNNYYYLGTGGGGGSGGTDPDNPGGGTDPDNPGSGEDKPGILDWLWNGIGKILGGIVDAISKILDAVFGRLVDLIVNLLQQIADAVVRVFDLLFTVLDRVLGAMTGGFTDFLKEFFYFLPPELVDGLTLTVIFGIILAIVRFFKGG